MSTVFRYELVATLRYSAFAPLVVGRGGSPIEFSGLPVDFLRDFSTHPAVRGL